MADFNLFQFGPEGRGIYVDASGALQITSDPTASGYILGYGEAGFALLVDASGRLLVNDLNGGGGGGGGTVDVVSNVATSTILGRTAAGSGDSEELTASAARTLLNVEDGSTADQTDAEIRAAVEAATDSNVFTDADHTKLNAIEASATADQTNAEIRTAVGAATDSNVFTDADVTRLGIALTSASGVNDLTDVNTAGATETDVLALSGSTWVPSGVSGGSASLSGLTDTSLSSPTSGQILEYNGTDWVNATNAGGGGGGGGPTYSSTTVASGDADYIWDVSSGAKQHEIIIDNCQPDTDSKRFKVAISTDGGSTYESGATAYFFQRSEDEGSDAYFSDGTTGQPQLMNAGIGNADGEGGKLMMQVGDCSSTDVVSIVSFQGAWVNLIGGPLTNRGMFGLGGSAQAITHIKIFWDSGNFRRGDVLLMERS